MKLADLHYYFTRRSNWTSYSI